MTITKHPSNHLNDQTPKTTTRSDKIKRILQTINIFDLFQKMHQLEKENEKLIKIIKHQQEIIEKKDQEITKQKEKSPYLHYQTHTKTKPTTSIPTKTLREEIKELEKEL